MDGFVRTLYEGEASGEYVVDYMLFNLTGFDADRLTVTDPLLDGATVLEQHNIVSVLGCTVDCGALPAGGRLHCSLRALTVAQDEGAVARLEGSAACSVLRSVAPKL